MCKTILVFSFSQNQPKQFIIKTYSSYISFGSKSFWYILCEVQKILSSKWTLPKLNTFDLSRKIVEKVQKGGTDQSRKSKRPQCRGSPDFQIFPKFKLLKCGLGFDDYIWDIWLIYDWISPNVTVRYYFGTVLARVGGGAKILISASWAENWLSFVIDRLILKQGYF